MKRIYSINVKKSKNYNSVSITEGFEGELNEFDFDVAKSELKDRVHSEVDAELEKIGGKIQ